MAIYGSLWQFQKMFGDMSVWDFTTSSRYNEHNSLESNSIARFLETACLRRFETHGTAAVQCLVIWVWQQQLWQCFIIWRCCGATCQEGEAIGGINLQFVLESAAIFGAGNWKCLVIPRFGFYLSCSWTPQKLDLFFGDKNFSTWLVLEMSF